MVEISVLLNIFGDEIFLKDALNNIFNQSFKDFEVICIYSEKNNLNFIEKDFSDKEIVIIKSEERIPETIDKCIDVAKGKYIYFMNSDCALNDESLSFIKDSIENNETDIILANSTTVNKYDEITRNDLMERIINITGYTTFSYESIGELIFELVDSNIDKLYNLEFIKNNEIHFSDSEYYGEKTFLLEALTSSKEISCIKRKLFTHYDYVYSLTHKNDSRLADIISMTNQVLDIFKQNPEVLDKELLFDYKINTELETLNMIKEESREELFNKIREDFINIVEDEDFSEEFINNISPYNRKRFEQIIISETYFEYKLLQKTLNEMTNYYDLISKRNMYNEAKLNEEKEAK